MLEYDYACINEERLCRIGRCKPPDVVNPLETAVTAMLMLMVKQQRGQVGGGCMVVEDGCR